MKTKLTTLLSAAALSACGAAMPAGTYAVSKGDIAVSLVVPTKPTK